MQATGCETGTIGAMVRAYRPGIEARRAILAELRRREIAAEAPPGVRELGRKVDQTLRPLRAHLAHLTRDGLVTVTQGRGRTPGAVSLTDAGRHAADLSTPP